MASYFDDPFGGDPFGGDPFSSSGHGSSFGSSSSSGLSIDDIAGVPKDISPEDRRSLLRRLGEGTLGGVGAFGNVLDLPGSSIRDWLVGKGGVDQWGSPLSGEDRVTGRDVLAHYGLAPKNKETGISGWFSDPMEAIYDVGGFLTEVFTDPLTYTGIGLFGKGLGAISKAGGVLKHADLLDDVVEVAGRKAAKKARAEGMGSIPRVGPRESRRTTTIKDILDDDVLQERFGGRQPLEEHLRSSSIKAGVDDFASTLDEGIGGAARMHIPGYGPVGPSVSPFGGKVGKLMDSGFGAVGESAVGQTVAAGFDAAAGGKFGKYAQVVSRIAKGYKTRTVPKAVEQAMGLGDHFAGVRQAAIDSGLGDIILSRSMVGSNPVGVAARAGDIIQSPSLMRPAKVLGTTPNNDVILRYLDDDGVYQTITTRAEDLKGASRISDLGQVDQINDDLINDALSGFATSVKELGDYDQALDSWLITDVTRSGEAGESMRGLVNRIPNPAKRKQVEQVLRKTINQMDSVTQPVYSRLVQKGLKIGEVEQYAVRHITPERQRLITAEQRTPQMVREYMGKPSSQLARNEAIRDIPTHLIQRMHDDPRFRRAIKEVSESGGGSEEAIVLISEILEQDSVYKPYLQKSWKEGFRIDDKVLEVPGNILKSLSSDADEAVRMAHHAQEIARSLVDNNAGGRLYIPDVLKNYVNYAKDMANLEATIDAMHATVARTATKVMGPGTVTVKEMLKSVGHDTAKGLQQLSAVMGDNAADIGKMYVPTEFLRQIKATKAIQKPGPFLEQFQKFVDGTTGMFKGGVTLPFPSFAFRNHISGQIVNITSGDINSVADLIDYTKLWWASRGLSRGPKSTATIKGIKDSSGNSMSNADIMKEVRTLDFIDDQTHFMDIAGPGKPKKAFVDFDVDELTPNWKLQGPMDAARSAKKVWSEASEGIEREPGFLRSIVSAEQVPGTKPMKGTKTARTAGRFVMETGSNLNRAVEFQNRMTMYLYLRKKGMSKVGAAERVKQLQFDYSDLTGFEKGYMKRAVPFYAFTRKMGGLFTSTIADRPGGPLAQLIRLTNNASSREHILPSYIGEQAAFQLFDPKEEGAASYVTGLGLAHEDPLSYMSGLSALGRGDVKQFARSGFRNVMSRTNPLFKGPLEFLTGQSFFQSGPGGMGRPIDEQDPPLGRLISNMQERITGRKQRGRAKPFGGSSFGPLIEAGISSSPVSRAVTSLRQMSDPRKNLAEKATNLLTGIRSTTLSPYQLDYAAKQSMEEVAQSRGYGAVYKSPYIDRYTLAEMLASGKITEQEFRDALMMQAEYKAMRGGRDKTERDLDRQNRLREIMASGAF